MNDVSSLYEIEEFGKRYSELPDLNDLMLCDIPDYLNTDGDEFIPINVDGSIFSTYDDFNNQNNIDTILSLVNDDEDKDKDDKKNKNPKSKGNPSVIIEFGSETLKEPEVKYKLTCKSAQVVNEDTIFGFVKQNSNYKKIKSIFKSGVIRQDLDDGSFGRLFKTVCCRHIIIDGVEFGSSNGGGTDISELIRNENIFTDFESTIEESQNAYDCLADTMIYTLYLRLIKNKSKSKYHKRNRNEPEKEFSKFINEKYLPLKEKYYNDIKKIDNSNRIKSTKGNITKLEKIANEILDRRNKFIDDIENLYTNFENYVNEVDIQEDNSELYSFHHDFDFKWLILNKKKNLNNDTSVNDNLDNYDIKEINPTQDASNNGFNQYFINLDKTIINKDKGIKKEISDTLIKISKNHIIKISKDSSINFNNQLNDEILELDKIYQKTLSEFKNHRINSVFLDDHELNELLKLFPEEAIWPESDTVTFKGETYIRYLFQNIPQHDTSLLDSSNNDENIDNIDFVPDISILDNLDDTSINENTDFDSTIPDDYKEIIDDDIPSEKDPNKNLGPSKVEISELKYWKRYCAIATMVTVLPKYWATGLAPIHIPPHYIKFPCIYIPLKVINLKKVGLIIVIGLAIRGIKISCMMLYVNMSSEFNSAMIPATLALVNIKDQFFNKLKKLNELPTNLSNLLLISLKKNNEALIKENKKYETQIDELRAMKIPSFNQIIKDVRIKLKQDTRQYITRIKNDASNIENNVNNIINESESMVNDVSSDVKNTKNTINQLKNSSNNKENKEDKEK